MLKLRQLCEEIDHSVEWGLVEGEALDSLIKCLVDAKLGQHFLYLLVDAVNVIDHQVALAQDHDAAWSLACGRHLAKDTGHFAFSLWNPSDVPVHWACEFD